MSEPAVTVVVPALDAAKTLPRTLEGLARQDLDAAYEVIVVDNCSSDGTYELAASFGAPVEVVRNGRTTGAGEARNRGVAGSRAPVIAFTDADCVPAPDWLARGLDAMASADLVQGAVEPEHEPASRYDRTIAIRSESGYFETANLFVRRDLFERVGGFEDWVVERGGGGLFGWSASPDREAEPARRPLGEDALFGWRARRAGARTAFASSALVRHAVSPGTRRSWIRNQRWKRHMPGLVARVPELRGEVLFGGLFLDRRSAAFDLALAAVATAALTRRRSALLAALPYAWIVRRDVAGVGGAGAVSLAATSVVADAVSLGCLAAGSAAWGAPVL